MYITVDEKFKLPVTYSGKQMKLRSYEIQTCNEKVMIARQYMFKYNKYVMNLWSYSLIDKKVFHLFAHSSDQCGVVVYAKYFALPWA